MKRNRHSTRLWQTYRHQGQNSKWLQAPSSLTSPGSEPGRCCSLSGRRVNGANPLTQGAETAWANQAASVATTGRPDVTQVSATGCRPCGHTLPEGSRRHLNRRQDVRSNRSVGPLNAGQCCGNCPDFRCKYGYHHTTVLLSSRLDAETRLAKGKFPLESLRWTSPSVDTLRGGFDHAFCMRGQRIHPCSKWQPDGCPFIIAILVRVYFRMNRNFSGSDSH
jgi:hypothetical protein